MQREGSPPPSPPPLFQPLEVAATALVAWGRLVVLGDAEGRLTTWDTASGRTSTLSPSAGMGMVRRLHVGPPVNPHLGMGQGQGLQQGQGRGQVVMEPRARLAAHFSGGHFAVYEVEPSGRLRASGSSSGSPSQQGAGGRVLDLAWMPLPW